MPDILELIGNADEGVYAVDSEQKIILWNGRAQEILGYSSEEVIGRYCYDLIAGTDDKGKMQCDKNCAVMEAAKSSGRAPSCYCVVKKKDGKSIWLHTTHVVIPSRDKDLEAVVHIFRDVSEYMEAKELVQRLQAYLSRDPAFATTPTEAQHIPAEKPGVSLTNREQQVIRLLTHGMTANAIAKELVISLATARNHIQNIIDKFGVHSALEAVAYTSKHGLL
ncbi:MAG: PAS domain S-box protein [Dehalococcoidia bacterium]